MEKTFFVQIKGIMEVKGELPIVMSEFKLLELWLKQKGQLQFTVKYLKKSMNFGKMVERNLSEKIRHINNLE